MHASLKELFPGAKDAWEVEHYLQWWTHLHAIMVVCGLGPEAKVQQVLRRARRRLDPDEFADFAREVTELCNSSYGVHGSEKFDPKALNAAQLERRWRQALRNSYVY